MRFLAALVGATCAAVSSFAADPVDLATHWETPPTEKQTLAAGDYKLSVDTSGNNITLTVRPYRGTALVIR